MTEANEVARVYTVEQCDKVAVDRLHAIQTKRILAGDRTPGDKRDVIEQAFARHRIEATEAALSRPAGDGWRDIDESLPDEIDLFREVKRQGARKRIDVVRVSLARFRECLRLPAPPAAPSSNNGESE
jgi:hypothetical protein